MTTIMETPADLGNRVGQQLGTSSWRRMTQEHIDTFAELTGDDQWIYTDVDRACGGPFGAPLVHAYLALSLTPAIIAEVVQIRETGVVLPVGIQDVRFPAPVPVGSRLRAAVAVTQAEQKLVGFEVSFSLRYEADGMDQPVCTAEVVVVYP